MSPRTTKAIWLAALAAIAAACGGAPEPEAEHRCIPNQSVSCTCPGGELGVQECAADGSGYGACTGCQGVTEGCTSEPDCDGCSSCFDSCVCQGGDAKACLKQCAGGSAAGGGGSGSGGGASGGTSGSGSSGAGGGYPGGASGSGGWSGGGAGGAGGGALDCPSCVAQSCASELAGCTQTAGCIELVQCAQSSGCSLGDYGCLLLACGAYLIEFGAVPPAMSLGSCASQACAVECS